MPSSLIIVALAAAWLVVLVPMIARKRQEIAQTNDSALAARVVRSGSPRNEWRKEFAMSENSKRGGEMSADDEDLIEDEDFEDYDEDLDDEVDDPEPAPARATAAEESAREDRSGRQYRPGRGGFDPEAAEIAARAKYVHRQRVVLALLLVAVVTGVLAGFVWSMFWGAHGVADAVLVGYLVYLRKQVRIEEEIRQRRLARHNEAVRRAPARERSPLEDIEVVPTERREMVGSERRPVPTSRVRRQAVVVDLDDEDPAFHELDEPGQLPYRRAVGE
ncbi:divisome protein SepX/GlpR [Qaidamihabitans albus]|uniref:divisome protein SepX/GlpR n=1 Tax=Qaidamihabitans albus TaxID=2795733 RepID=UPI0018F124E3|nr:gephyrin-like molybdotransferase receptor GlpR [Qaidamihabitans albus]